MRAPKAVTCLLMLVLFAAGCATLPPPTDAMGLASAEIIRAENAGASQYAPEEMRLARKALEQARELIDSNDNLQARYAAEIALGHAELAQAVAEAERADQSADRAENELARVRRNIQENEQQESR